MKLLAVIPAWCGDRRSADYYLRQISGRALISWSIGHAVASLQVSHIVVMSDREELLTAVQRLDEVAATRLIPEAVTFEACVWRHLEELSAETETPPEAVVILDPAYPVRGPGRLEQAVARLQTEGADALVSVCAEPVWCWHHGETPHPGYALSQRFAFRARAEEACSYRENGSLVLARTAGWQARGHMLGDKVVLFGMDERESLSVDSMFFAGIASEPAPGSPLRWMDAIVFDFDGVLTDNRVLVSQDGTESVYCSRGDGMGFDILRTAGIPAFIMSSETNPVVSARARKLKLPVAQAVKDKGESLLALCREQGFKPERIIFVGNDVNDLPAMRMAGFPVAVADAVPAVRQAAWRVLNTPGGAGVVRELIDTILGMPDARP